MIDFINTQKGYLPQDRGFILADVCAFLIIKEIKWDFFYFTNPRLQEGQRFVASCGIGRCRCA